MSSSIASEHINIFPYAKNRVKDRNARLFYEHNVANIIRQVIDTDGFIITPPLGSGGIPQDIKNWFTWNPTSGTMEFMVAEGDPVIQFNLGGYYIEIEERALFPASTSTSGLHSWTVYAYIQIDSTTREVVGQDNGGKFEGVKFTIDENEVPEGAYCIALFDVSADGSSLTSVCLTRASYTILNFDRHCFDIIDGQRSL